MTMSAKNPPVDLTSTKDVFVSAMRFATSVDGPCPPFEDELRISAQEQVEFMIGDGEEMSLVVLDGEVQMETRVGMLKVFSTFERELASLLSRFGEIIPEASDDETKMVITRCVYDIEWTCDILLKMNLMRDFIDSWTDMSSKVLDIIEDKRLDSGMWGLKLKLIVVTTKVLEAVGYGTVVVPAHTRLQLLKLWLPYIRKMKPVLESLGEEDIRFPYKMDEDLCQSIEGATTSLILALPSTNQAEIFMDWMNTGYVTYPDLSEAFELWCYRTKSARRRLVAGVVEQCHNEPASL